MKTILSNQKYRDYRSAPLPWYSFFSTLQASAASGQSTLLFLEIRTERIRAPGLGAIR
ncbi:MAG: hypothetical protein ACI4MK_08210 [Aristaeellaceae bacterium]